MTPSWKFEPILAQQKSRLLPAALIMAVSGPVHFKRFVYVLRELQPCPDKLATIVNCFFDLRDPLKQWAADQLQHVANSAELKQPLLKAIPGKGDHPLTVRARGLLIQYELVLWIAKMNTRMLVVPPSQVYARYVLLWGMGPHGPRTTKHLRKFGEAAKTIDRRKWLRRLKQTWRLSMRTKAPIPKMAGSETGDKVRVFLIWVAYLSETGFSLDESLYINLDETALRQENLRQGLVSGSVEDTSGVIAGSDMGQTVSRDSTTLVALLCNQAAWQKIMPQWLLPKKHKDATKWKAIAEEFRTQGGCVQVITGTSGWMTVDTMIIILDHLKNIIHEHGGSKVVIVMDCLRAHVHFDVVKHIAKLNWRVLLVPAGLTSMLQPLDVFAFAGLKQILKSGVVNLQLGREDRKITLHDWIVMARDAISRHMVSDASSAKWALIGYKLPLPPACDSFLKQMLGTDMGFHRRLTVAELEVYMGSKSAVVHPWLFRDPLTADSRKKPVSLIAPSHRLRSKRSIASLGPEAAGPDSSV